MDCCIKCHGHGGFYWHFCFASLVFCELFFKSKLACSCGISSAFFGSTRKFCCPVFEKSEEIWRVSFIEFGWTVEVIFSEFARILEVMFSEFARILEVTFSEFGWTLKAMFSEFLKSFAYVLRVC